VATRVLGQIENALFRRNLASYKPVPVPSTSSYSSSQVSIIVCTVDTLLARCLHTWLANNPFEVIIVTIPQHLDHIRSVVLSAKLSELDLAKVTVLCAPEKGKREQLAVGIKAARGSIIVGTDDHITWHPDFLKCMLPCFEDKSVGAIGPMIEPIIPEERRDADIITPWEVAAMRVQWNRNPQLKAAYAAARWCWVLAGVNYCFRAEILKV
jgi:cellulose synthase/poly-beta-1,6-N-acetylglucosamine synthase-like glycosyltransferase